MKLTREYSQGSETHTDGLLGSVRVCQPHPAIEKLWSVSQPGQLWSSRALDTWFVIIRLEKFLPTQLDEPMPHRLMDELFENWLREQIQPVWPIIDVWLIRLPHQTQTPSRLRRNKRYRVSWTAWLERWFLEDLRSHFTFSPPPLLKPLPISPSPPPTQQRSVSRSLFVPWLWVSAPSPPLSLVWLLLVWLLSPSTSVFNAYKTAKLHPLIVPNPWCFFPILNARNSSHNLQVWDKVVYTILINI